MFATPARKWTVLAVGGVAFIVLSMMYFGAFKSGAVVSGAGKSSANGKYVWKSLRTLNLSPVSVASNQAGAPTSMELLLAVSAQSPYSTTVPPSIQQEGVLWMIGQAPSTVYYAAPARGDSVPTDGWIVRNGVDPAPSVTSVGSKPSTFPIIGPDPNASPFWSSPIVLALKNQPVNCAIILFCCYIWNTLRQRGWGWEEVGSSYKNVVLEGQVWRVFSSSFSHVDLLHLAMNMLSLYQVGWLEEYYGSMLYATLSLSLVITTMIVGFVTYHILITRFNKEHYINVIGVGYSCVLFAWIVVSTTKTTKYCPLPGLQKLCLPTWQIPVGGGSTLPFSSAPFVLLLAMHYLVPKASFVGHLAGIIMGYPLAWGVLDPVLGPEAMARITVLVLLLRELWFGTDRRIVSIGSTSSGAIAPGDVPLPLHDGSRSRRLLLAAVSYTTLTALLFPVSSWPSSLCSVALSVLLWEGWRSSIAFSLPGLAAVGTNVLPLQAAAKRLSLVCVVGIVDLLCAVATLPALFIVSSGGHTFALLLKLGAVLVSTAAATVCFLLLRRASTETQSPLLYYMPSTLGGSMTVSSPASGVVLEDGVLVPRGRASARPGRSPNMPTGEGRRLGTA